jgi:hypothetical protein
MVAAPRELAVCAPDDSRPRARAPVQHPCRPWSLVPSGSDHRGDRPCLLRHVPRGRWWWWAGFTVLMG